MREIRVGSPLVTDMTLAQETLIVTSHRWPDPRLPLTLAMSAAYPTLAIVGRPNVGKSTLLNRLAKRRIALVHDMPGVTRDWKETLVDIGGQTFQLLDTAGLEEVGKVDALSDRMTAMTHRAMDQAHLILFMIDARAGVTPFDEHFGDLIRTSGKDVLLLANKCEEGKAGEAGLLDAYSLGLDTPIAVSAEHGDGIGDLLDALVAWGKGWRKASPCKTKRQRKMKRPLCGSPLLAAPMRANPHSLMPC